MSRDIGKIPYKAGITREQFLFHEMRTTAKLMNKGFNDEEIVNEIIEDNLFQYPTEKMIKNLAKVCVARLHTINDKNLVEIIANGSAESAKQICLYAMMKHYRIVWEFMTTVIAEKFKLKDLSYSRKDINVFFTRLQEQNDAVASWSDSTIRKIKQVLTKMLVDNGYLDSTKSETLNPVLIDLDLKNVLEEKNEKDALAAFNYFGGL